MADQQTYQIALDPALGIDPAALADAWNANPETAAHGLLQRGDTSAKGYDLAGMGLEFVGGLAIGLITNYLYDLIVKGAFATKPTTAPAIAIQQIDQPDGSKIIVVVKET